MRARSLPATAGLLICLLPGCGGGGEDSPSTYTPLRAAQLARSLDGVREAAGRGDLEAADDTLRGLQAVLAEFERRGEIGADDYARVRAAIRDAQRELR